MELVASTVSVKISPLIQKELQLLNIKKTFSTGSEVGLKLKLIHPKWIKEIQGVCCEKDRDDQGSHRYTPMALYRVS